MPPKKRPTDDGRAVQQVESQGAAAEGLEGLGVRR